jgi:hypothetical protein
MAKFINGLPNVKSIGSFRQFACGVGSHGIRAGVLSSNHVSVIHFSFQFDVSFNFSFENLYFTFTKQLSPVVFSQKCLLSKIS